jgi:hypothetical protein
VSFGESLIEGWYQGADERGLLLKVGVDNRSVPFSTIDTLWVRGSKVKKGAVIGGVTLAVGGGLIVSSFASGFCENDCSGAGGEGFAIGALLGLPVGALVGAAIGSIIPSWHRRHP